MRTSLFSVGTTLSVLSAVHASQRLDSRDSTCLNYTTAYQVSSNFGDLIRNYNGTFANEVLTTNFTDYSDSVSELINNGCPNGPAQLGTATFTSRSSFEASQGTQPAIPFDILQVWYTCDTAFMRWQTTAPGTVTPEELVTGIIIMETVYNGTDSSEPFLIDTVYSEFNSGAWLYDTGIFVPTCNSTSSSSSSASTSTATSTTTSTATSTSASTATSTSTSIATFTSTSTLTTASVVTETVTKTLTETSTLTSTGSTKTNTVTVTQTPTVLSTATASATSTASDSFSICVWF